MWYNANDYWRRNTRRHHKIKHQDYFSQKKPKYDFNIFPAIKTSSGEHRLVYLNSRILLMMPNLRKLYWSAGLWLIRKFFSRFLLSVLANPGPVSAGCYLQRLECEDGIPPKPVQHSLEHTARIEGRTLWNVLSLFLLCFILWSANECTQLL
jgi:hypothetical protein